MSKRLRRERDARRLVAYRAAKATAREHDAAADYERWAKARTRDAS